MPRPLLDDGELHLRAVNSTDIEAIRHWRNDQMDVLRQSEPISQEAQVRYFQETIWPDLISLEPKQILLAIERQGELIGYGGLVHISWPYRRAEVSFLLDPKIEQNSEVLYEYFIRYLALIQELAFKDLRLNRLTTETYAQRVVHIGALEAAGHRIEGRLREHVIVNDLPTDSLVHGLLAHEWHAKFQTLKRTNTLVTSASRKAPLLRAMKSALSQIGENNQVIAGDIDVMAPAKFEADGFWHMPRLSESVLGELIEGCHSRGISIIFPTRDGELDFWARHRATFLEAGIEIIVSSPEATERCLDKLKFSRFGSDFGFPIIQSAVTPDEFVNMQLVVKERYGAGSRGLGLDMTYQQAIEHAKTLDEPIFQPYVTGPEISIDGWLSNRGQVAGVVLRRRDRVVAGESQVTTTFRDTRLEEQAIEILSAIGLRGPVVLQAIVVDGGLQVIECNPRFGGASTTAIAAGLNSLYWSLAEALDKVESPNFHRVSGEVRQIRLPVDRVIYGSNF
jgi:carbamoyl-phosphate synthase large subunit